MRRIIVKKLLTYFLIAFVACFSISAMAAGLDVGTILGFVGPLLPEYIEKFPILGDIINVMLTARVIVKPLMSALLSIYKDKPNFKFLSFSESVLDNKIYQTVAFVLDWLLSVKLPKKK